MNFLDIQQVQQKFHHLTSIKDKPSLDLTRGKPHADQLSLSNSLLEIKIEDLLNNQIDLRNYGELFGLEDCRKLGSEIIGCSKDQVIAGGNSSLTLMHQYLASLYFHGPNQMPWSNQERISILCPVPGYDRHFKLCEEFGINMIPVPLTGQGPDIDNISELVAQDASIKAIWCVPKHSNPTGETYSEDCVSELLRLSMLKKDGFKILWDNAYAVHDFQESPDLPHIFNLASKMGALNSVISFASTSKITFAGGGIGFIAMSEENLHQFSKHYASMVIGPDKINQARHTHFFKDIEAIGEHMKNHAEIVKPKFQEAFKWLSKQNHGTWTKPTGGYFISFNSNPGLAKEIITLASQAGLKLTKAGSTYPYGVDPLDCNIRIAPTACSLEEVEKAMEIFVTCLSLATLKKN